MDIDLLYIMIDFIKLIIKQLSYFISALKKNPTSIILRQHCSRISVPYVRFFFPIFSIILDAHWASCFIQYPVL